MLAYTSTFFLPGLQTLNPFSLTPWIQHVFILKYFMIPRHSMDSMYAIYIYAYIDPPKPPQLIGIYGIHGIYDPNRFAFRPEQPTPPHHFEDEARDLRHRPSPAWPGDSASPADVFPWVSCPQTKLLPKLSVVYSMFSLVFRSEVGDETTAVLVRPVRTHSGRTEHGPIRWGG